MLLAGLLLANSMTAAPSVAAIYLLVAALHGGSGFHRPTLACLAVAGAADMVSGVFRGTIWIGGAICCAAVVATGFALSRFWAYRSTAAGAG